MRTGKYGPCEDRGGEDRGGEIPVAALRAVPAVWVRRLLGRPVLGPERQHLGHVRDVATSRSRGTAGTVVTGLIADVGGHSWFVPAMTIRDLQGVPVVLRECSTRAVSGRRSGEHLLVQDVLGRPVRTAAGGPSPRISDIALRRTAAGWVVWAVDTRTSVQRLVGSPRRLVEWDELSTRRLA